MRNLYPVVKDAELGLLRDGDKSPLSGQKSLTSLQQGYFWVFALTLVLGSPSLSSDGGGSVLSFPLQLSELSVLSLAFRITNQ